MDNTVSICIHLYTVLTWTWGQRVWTVQLVATLLLPQPLTPSLAKHQRNACDQVLLLWHGSQRRADPSSPARRQLRLRGRPDPLPGLAGRAQGGLYLWSAACASLGRSGAGTVDGNCQVDSIFSLFLILAFASLQDITNVLKENPRWFKITRDNAGLWQEGPALLARLTWSLCKRTWFAFL